MSALCSFSFLGGPIAGLMFGYLATLPLFLVGMGLGVKQLYHAAGTGLLAVGIFGGWPASIIYSIIYILPTWVVTYIINPMHRDAGKRATSKIKEQLGQVLANLACMSAILFICSTITLKFLGFTTDVIEGLINHTISHSMPALNDVLREKLTNNILGIITNPLFPGTLVVTWIIFVVFNAMIAQALLVKFDYNLVTKPNYKKLTLPNWISLPFVGAAVITLFSVYVNGASTEFFGRNLSTIFSIPYFFLGLAVIHDLADSSKLKTLYLTLTYLVLIISGGPEQPNWAAIMIVAIGVLDHWLMVRNLIPHAKN